MSDSASRVPISFSASDLIMVTDACEPGFTTHRVVFLTLSFKSLLLSIEKQNGQASLLVRYIHRRNRDL